MRISVAHLSLRHLVFANVLLLAVAGKARHEPRKYPRALQRRSLIITVILILCACTQEAIAATLPAGFTETQIATGISKPTAMAFAPDGRLFVCQQTGQLRVIKNGALLPAPFLSLTVDSNGERGLLGIAFDPDFENNHFVYVYYTATTPTTHNRVSRFTANGDVAVAGSEFVLLDLDDLSLATNHNGGALHFGPDGKLYIAVGENATPSNAQTLSNLLGKLLRINKDGTIPADNPFFNTASGKNRAIWAIGLRNPYTFAFQTGTGRVFINDVGQSTWEEINLGQAGANYGWPTCEGSCSNPSFVNPIFQYAHGSSSTTGCAITGAAFYNPPVNQFPSSYVGSYFFADLCSGWMRRLDPATNTVSDFASGISNPVDIQTGLDGNLYYLSIGSSGVFKVQYSLNQTAPMIQFSAQTARAGEGNGSISINVQRTGDVSAPATIDYATSSGTASDKSDYTTALGTLSFAAGETVKTLTILLTDDAYVEGDETITLSLSNPKGAGLGTTSIATLTITDNDTTQPTSNPIDGAQIFVRQHYLDFLDREADSGGLAYWTGEITKCGSDQLCVHNRRIDVSAAFFVEQEFQQTGYFVYRIYKAALARRPIYTEFMRDRSALVASPALETNKTDYVNSFTLRQEFLSKYPASLSGTQFIDALLQSVKQSSGVDLSSQRDSLINDYNQNQSRARVLRAVVDNSLYMQAEYNNGFVLAQYFGYLRRDPDEAGYQFWLDVLNNKQPGNFRGMVCSFITSAEYQDRFSPVRTRSNNDCK